MATHFFVPGHPKPQGSKRAYTHGGKVRLVESAGQPLKDWRSDVKLSAAAHHHTPPLEGPVHVALTFHMPKPKSEPKTKRTWPTRRPDIDKLARGVLDALTGICFKDDSQIVALWAEKKWDTDQHDNQPGVSITVTGIEEEQE